MDKCTEVLGNHYFIYIYINKCLALIWGLNNNVLNKHKCERINHTSFIPHITSYIHVLVLTEEEVEDFYLALNISMQIYRRMYAFVFNYRLVVLVILTEEDQFSK